MEEEEREAQSAKLQELIRRGTPEDLREANQLMKVMAGYDTRSKVDYRAKAAEEVGKIQQKARLLEERLAQFKPGDKIVDGDVFSELASALSSAQPKIQKMCEEESDDHEAVAKLLEINDSIHRTFERYRLLKKGDIEGANKLAQGAPISTSTGSSSSAAKGAAAELSLIDFDDTAGTNGSGAGQAASSTGGVENDLLGLSISDTPSNFGQGGGIALGFGANTSEFSLFSPYLPFSNKCQISLVPPFSLQSRKTARLELPRQPLPSLALHRSPPHPHLNLAHRSLPPDMLLRHRQNLLPMIRLRN